MAAAGEAAGTSPSSTTPPCEQTALPPARRAGDGELHLAERSLAGKDGPLAAAGAASSGSMILSRYRPPNPEALKSANVNAPTESGSRPWGQT